MRVPAHFLLAVSILLSGVAAAPAQNDREKYNLKPLVPPVLPLPPNALVTPGGVGSASSGSDPSPFSGNSAPPPPSSPGLKITIPR